MKRLRTLVVMHTTLVPPDTLEGHSAKEIEEWRTEYDVVSTLKKSGHEVRCLGISDSLEELRSVITEWKPEIVFNLLEEFDGIVTYDQHVVAFLELLRQPYTGCNPRGLLLARDKPLCKQLLSYHRIPVAAVRRVPARHQAAAAAQDQVPAVREVHHRRRLARHLAGVDRHRQGAAQAAHPVRARPGADRRAGRGIHRGPRAVRRRDGQRPPHAAAGVGDEVRLAARELRPGIATRRVKWDKKYQKKHGIDTYEAKDLSPAVLARLDKLSRRIYRCLGLSGCARIDYRMNADGQIYVIEANPNPNLAAEEDFAQSALAAGVSYPDLLEKLLALGAGYQAEWRAYYG